MSRYRKLVSFIRRALGLPPVVEVAVDLFEITYEALDPEPVTKGHPLSHRDVEHQQAQIRSATRGPAHAPRSIRGAPGTSKDKPRRP